MPIRLVPKRIWSIAPLAAAMLAVTGATAWLPARAQDATPDILALVRAGNWPAADAAAAQVPDPVARKIVLYYRILTPNAASLPEITAFLASSPDWPQRALIARRRDEALAIEPDDVAVLAMCDHASPAIATTAARLRCADAFSHAGRQGAADDLVRRAWMDSPSDPIAEARFMQRWATTIHREDQWRRFDRLAWTDLAGAKRQAIRLDAAYKPLAETRLALKGDDPSALALVNALTPEQRAQPAIFLEEARWLRRANRDGDALALWQSGGADAEKAASPERLAAFWDERNLLARRRLRDGDNAGALALVAGHGRYPAEQEADAEFLAGFIALRRLNDPAGAAPHFEVLTKISKAVITEGRAHFWLARTAAARGDMAAAKAEYDRAAAYPSTFYGQLAILSQSDEAALAARIRAQRDPQSDNDQVVAFAGRELARAGALVVAWGDPRRAPNFLLRLNDVGPGDSDRALDARLAAGFGLQDVAVTISRRAGRDGVALIEAGWPVAADVPPDAGVDPALALGIIRQESSFDTTTISPVGARGLMQLMPATATETAHQLGVPIAIPALLTDPGYNVQLGTTYLHGLLDRYGGSIPLAVAAYNAGPGRVTDWLATNGDPRAGTADILDWLELIPLGETRNYVQRVIENVVIYRAKRGENNEHPLAQWLR